MSKLKALKEILLNLKRVVVAYSGGVDSTFLLKVAFDALGEENVVAVTARSETYPYSEYKEAKRFASEIGARHITIHTRELGIKKFMSNPVNRCYYCKKELFKKLRGIATTDKIDYVIDGTNYDDLKDIRYGRIAAKELSVRSPLLEAGITKYDIRKFSKNLGLPTWEKPSFACLASRFPFMYNITAKDLLKIEKAESFLRSLGIKQIRVRHHKDTARLEVYKEDFGKVLRWKERIAKKLKSIGYNYISLDLEGYRTGSMHKLGKRGGVAQSG